MARLGGPSAGLKPAGAWLCLLLFGWALAGSWFGHTHVPRCDSTACHALAENGERDQFVLSSPGIEESNACLACHLLRCLQTASASAAATVPAAAAEEALPPEAVLVASTAAWTHGSARAPPLV